MSTAEITRFLGDLETNESLRTEVRAVGLNAAGVAGIANARDYDFTAQEAQAYADSNAATGSGELSDADLENVAGAGCAYGPQVTNSLMNPTWQCNG
jgi:predicted ribosomally synthesized peptide with nif11-like leader